MLDFLICAKEHEGAGQRIIFILSVNSDRVIRPNSENRYNLVTYPVNVRLSSGSLGHHRKLYFKVMDVVWI